MQNHCPLTLVWFIVRNWSKKIIFDSDLSSSPVDDCCSCCLSSNVPIYGRRMGNLRNAVIALLVPLPSILFFLNFIHHHSPTSVISKWSIQQHPLVLANIIFFFNVNLLFWLIGLLQSCHWMIDLYWTVIPVMLVHYFAGHPLARSDVIRSNVVILLTWVWSVRLTHNYFRREKWQWGVREDWRFADMRSKFGEHWWWMSFFAVYFSQQIFLIGVCLPMLAVHSTENVWNVWWDTLATIACITGVVVAYIADTQLHNFMAKNEMLKDIDAPTMLNLEHGLWRYSRHPNYFGEQLWWWGLFLFGWNSGHGWTFVGPFVNSLCLVHVTKLVEQKMLKKETTRAEAYRKYQKTTSVWIPWLSRKCKNA